MSRQTTARHNLTCGICGHYVPQLDRETMLASARYQWDETLVDEHRADASHVCIDSDPYGARAHGRAADTGLERPTLAELISIALERKLTATRPAWAVFTTGRITVSQPTTTPAAVRMEWASVLRAVEIHQLADEAAHASLRVRQWEDNAKAASKAAAGQLRRFADLTGLDVIDVVMCADRQAREIRRLRAEQARLDGNLRATATVTRDIAARSWTPRRERELRVAEAAEGHARAASQAHRRLLIDRIRELDSTPADAIRR
jgi:hypothetical protein